MAVEMMSCLSKTGNLLERFQRVWPTRGPGSPLYPLLLLQLRHHPRDFFFFLQYCVNHFTELSSLHPTAPNRITSDMFIFALSSILTLVSFPKECLACHPLSNSLMIKTKALAVNMPEDRPAGPLLKKKISSRILITSAFTLNF